LDGTGARTGAIEGRLANDIGRLADGIGTTSGCAGVGVLCFVIVPSQSNIQEISLKFCSAKTHFNIGMLVCVVQVYKKT